MTKMHKYSQRNATLTYVSAFFSDLVFILPIWLLFSMHELGLSTLLATSLFMSVWLTSGLMEIPAGALADRHGRKRMYLIGVALLSLYPLAYALKLPVVLIFFICFLSGVGSALRSGTLVALTHESFKQENRGDKAYHSFLSSQQTVTFIGRALSGVLGGLLYAANPTLPFTAMFISYVLMFVTGLFVVDTAKERSTLSNRLHVKETLRQIRGAPLVLTLLVTHVAAQILGEAIWTAYQPFFASDGLSADTIGLLFSVIAIVSGIGSFVQRFMMRQLGVLKIQMLAGYLTLAAALLLNTSSDILHLLAIIPAAFGAGISVGPLIATMQKHVSGKFQTTALSIIGVIQYVVYGVASLYVSFALDVLGDAGTRHFLAVEACIIAIVLAVIFLRKRNIDTIITNNRETLTTTEPEVSGA